MSFRHEKYIEFGGPDGGDGGAGGDIYFQPDARVLSLNHLRKDKLYKAQDGRAGQGQQKSGKKGQDLYIKVPVGCQVIDTETDEIIKDFIDEEPWVFLHGGRGGKGNAFFTSSTRQAPRFAQEGEDTEEHSVKLSLKLIADIGLVGFPNAGKSTLLKALTNANPKIGNYPFTTLSPNLGVIELNESQRALVADIPGILEGASKGHGLGLSFLKHIERVKILLFVLDISQANVDLELKILRDELHHYNEELLNRPCLVVLNKIDLVDDEEFLADWIRSIEKENHTVIGISAHDGTGLNLLLEKIISLMSSPEFQKAF